MTRIKNLLRYRTGWVLLSIGVYGIIWWLFSWFITGEVLYMFSTLKARAVFSGCIVLPLVVSAFMIDDYYHDYIIKIKEKERIREHEQKKLLREAEELVNNYYRQSL